MIAQQSSFSKYKHQLPSDAQIIKLFKTTFTSTKTQKISQTQQILSNLLTQQLFIQKLFIFLQTQHLQIQREQQIKRSISIQIKKFSYQFSKKQNVNKQKIIQKIFYLIISKLDTKCKQILGTALEYFMNHDSRDQYKPKVICKVVQMLKLQTDQHILQGLTIASFSCLNSLIEADEQFDFFHKVYTPFIQNLSKILQLIKPLSQSPSILSNPSTKPLLKLSKRIFQFFQLCISRLIQQQSYIQPQLSTLRQNPNLQLIIYSYLSNFNNKNSIISTIPQIDQIKQLNLLIIMYLYQNHIMPENIFNLIFVTFILEAAKQQFQDEQQRIIIKVIQILQSYLKNKFYLKTFHDHQMQIMLSLLTYLSTKSEEIDMLENQPEKFVELSQDITEPLERIDNIKVKASALLKMLVSKIDQTLRNVMEIVVIIITAGVQYNNNNINTQQKPPQMLSPVTQLYNNLLTQFSTCPFFHLPLPFQLQTSLTILSIISPYISKRKDLHDVVYALLVTNFQSFQQITQPITLLRFIRLIGYYPTAAYYQFIKSLMSKGKVFVLQGLKTFQKILKANRYPHVFQILSEIFTEIFNLINVNDSIFQTIIMNHYQRVLKKSITLYTNFLIKIRDTFVKEIQQNQHISLICLGYVYNILNKQEQTEYRQEVMKYFYQMQDYKNKLQEHYQQKLQLQQDPPEIQKYQKVLKILNNYQDKIVDVYCIMAKKQTEISQKAMNFAYKQLKNLKNFNTNDQIWRFYNNVILKFDSFSNQITKFYNAFMYQITHQILGYLIDPNIAKPQQLQNLIQILPNLCYLTSQILASYPQTHLTQQSLSTLLSLLQPSSKQIKQYLCFIIFTYIYTNPIKFKQTLTCLNIYQQTFRQFLSIYYGDKLIKKTFLLAMAKLLQIQQIYFQDILKQCLVYFRQQAFMNTKKNQKKNNLSEYIDPKLRRMFKDQDNDKNNKNQLQNQQQMIQQTTKNNNEFTSISYQNLRHPYQIMSQYDQWKIRIWHNTQKLQQLDQHTKDQLRQILQMDWIGKGLRKIVTVKQQGDKSSGMGIIGGKGFI